VADDAGEKTEQATPKKREESRQKGQVARSVDLNTAVILITAFIAFYYSGDKIWNGMRQMFITCFNNLHTADLGVDNVTNYFTQGVLFILMRFMPYLISIVIVAFLINVAQVGMMVSGESLVPQISRLNPISGLKRIFSIRAVVKTAISILKVVFVTAVVVIAIRGEAGRLNDLIDMGVGEIALYAFSICFKVGIWIGIALLFLGILDYGYQYWQHEKDMRMTKQEVKEELKRMEGDPHVRERRKQIQRQLSMSRMMQKVPEAQVVVTNPTHYAIALKYLPDEMIAPLVVAKGVDHLALRIQEVAKENGVPLHEDPMLAKELYKRVDIDQQIPGELFAAVAEVLAYVYRTKPNRAPVPVG